MKGRNYSRQTDWQTDRVTDRQTEWQRQRETDRNTTDHRGGGGQLWSPVDLPLSILDHQSVCVVCGGVWGCVGVCGYMWLCVRMYVRCVVCENVRVVRMCEGVCEDVWGCVRMWGWLGCVRVYVRMCGCMWVCIVRIWGCPTACVKACIVCVRVSTACVMVCIVYDMYLWSWILKMEVLKADMTAFHSRLTHGYTIEPTHLPHLTLLLMQNLGLSLMTGCRQVKGLNYTFTYSHFTYSQFHPSLPTNCLSTPHPCT